jgi:hypothetical protein
VVFVKVLKAFADEGLHAAGVAEQGAHPQKSGQGLQESLQERAGFAGNTIGLQEWHAGGAGGVWGRR